MNQWDSDLAVTIYWEKDGLFYRLGYRENRPIQDMEVVIQQSGGPVFLGSTESNLIVGVTSFGLNSWCRGVDFAYRTDQQDVIDWILETIPDDQVGLIQILET